MTHMGLQKQRSHVMFTATIAAALAATGLAAVTPTQSIDAIDEKAAAKKAAALSSEAARNLFGSGFGAAFANRRRLQPQHA